VLIKYQLEGPRVLKGNHFSKTTARSDRGDCSLRVSACNFLCLQTVEVGKDPYTHCRCLATVWQQQACTTTAPETISLLKNSTEASTRTRNFYPAQLLVTTGRTHVPGTIPTGQPLQPACD